MLVSLASPYGCDGGGIRICCVSFPCNGGGEFSVLPNCYLLDYHRWLVSQSKEVTVTLLIIILSFNSFSLGFAFQTDLAF